MTVKICGEIDPLVNCDLHVLHCRLYKDVEYRLLSNWWIFFSLSTIVLAFVSVDGDLPFDAQFNHIIPLYSVFCRFTNATSSLNEQLPIAVSSANWARMVLFWSSLLRCPKCRWWRPSVRSLRLIVLSVRYLCVQNTCPVAEILIVVCWDWIRNVNLRSTMNKPRPECCWADT